MLSKMSDPPVLYTVAAVAKMFSVSEKYIYRAIQEDRLRAMKDGRSIRISADAVQTYLEQWHK